MSVRKNNDEIASISKACQLIDVLSTQKSWPLADLCKILGIPKTTAHRILTTLESNGYVIQEEKRGEYSLSFKLVTIGSKVVQHTGLVDIARPHCQELLRKVNETVNLSIVSDTDMLVIDKHVTTQILRHDSIIGSSFPLFQSASGKIFLAFGNKDEVDQVLHKIKLQIPNNTYNQIIDSLYSELQDIRQTGIAYDFEEVFQGVRCTAVPIYDYNDKYTASLSISAPTVRLNKQISKKISDNLIHTSIKISQRLGASTSCFPFNIK
jgi:IclR family KDG regulon transcriptional repressor